MTVEPHVEQHFWEGPDEWSRATITVTPDDADLDVVVDLTSGERVDDGFRGESEVLVGEGPVTETLTVSSFFGDPGGYTITVTFESS